MEESSRDDPENPDPPASDNGVLALPLHGEENAINQEISTPDRDQRIRDAQSSTDSLVRSYPDEQSLQAMSNSRNLKLTRSWSFSGEMERTPANGFEKLFPGRPYGLRRKLLPLTYGASTKLSMNGSPSSVGSPSVDGLRTNSTPTTANEDITSIQTFVAGMKEMVKLEYQNQLADGQVRINHFNSFLNF